MPYQPTDKERSEKVRNAAGFEFDEVYSDAERAYTLQAGKPLLAYCRPNGKGQHGLTEDGLIELLFAICLLINESEDGINESPRTT